MRIALLGKGGSGKSTLAAALIDHLRRTGDVPVVAFDGDVNMHLADLLGIHQRPLHPERAAVASMLEPALAGSPILGSLPPGDASFRWRARSDDPILAAFAEWNDERTVALMTVGSYEPDDAGSACFHSKLQVGELLLHRFDDRDGSAMVMDCTAGVDNIGTSLFFAADLDVFVVEPTLRSVEVAKQFSAAAEAHDRSVVVVANKVRQASDLEWIVEQLGGIEVIGSVPASNAVNRIDRGEHEALEEFAHECAVVFDALVARSQERVRDWDIYRRRIADSYVLACTGWANGAYGQDLLALLPPDLAEYAGAAAQ